MGIEPLAPAVGDPNFDLAWEHAGTIYVAEVKSTTDRNEERQLRLGLGQVLRYRSMLAARLGRAVRAVLVPERTPSDASWQATCANARVLLVAADRLPYQLPDALATEADAATPASPRHSSTSD
jgi:hypothetical protein